MIKVYDNLVSDEYQVAILNEVINLNTYRLNIMNTDEDEENGASSPLLLQSVTLQILSSVIEMNVSEVQGLSLIDSYVNCFFPNESPAFHYDADDENTMTIVYYTNTGTVGGTEFYDDSTHEVRTVLPRSGRFVVFNSNTWHRATSLPTEKRFTVVLKYAKPNLENILVDESTER